MLRDALRLELEHQLAVTIIDVSVVNGGDIHRAYKLRCRDGREVFVKTNDATPPGMFATEAAGLRWLARFGHLQTPTVLAARDSDQHGVGYLALTWHAPSPASRPTSAAAFGRALALLHSERLAAPGWVHDGWIGTLPQRNTDVPSDATVGESWAAFWFEQRLRPMARRAQPALGTAVSRLVDAVCARAAPLLTQVDQLGPLHGDLWSGNVLWSTDGPLLVDPAAYAGDPEVDLAMMALFGGFAPATWGAYFEMRPRRPGFEARKSLYQLWPLLVHVALFGGGYSGQVQRAAKAVLAAV